VGGGTFVVDFYSDWFDTGIAVNDGKWHFVGFSLPAGSTSITAVVDGTIVSGTFPSPPNIAGGTSYQIGRWVTTGPGDTNPHWFSGIIDEVRIYNRALTAGEIGQLYRGLPVIGPEVETRTLAGLANTSYSVPENRPLSEGRWYWRVRAVDWAGNESPWSETWEFEVVVDNTPPASFVENIGPYWENEPPLRVTARATDDRSGVARVALVPVFAGQYGVEELEESHH
jgi:hypothetical protein